MLLNYCCQVNKLRYLYKAKYNKKHHFLLNFNLLIECIRVVATRVIAIYSSRFSMGYRFRLNTTVICTMA